MQYGNRAVFDFVVVNEIRIHLEGVSGDGIDDMRYTSKHRHPSKMTVDFENDVILLICASGKQCSLSDSDGAAAVIDLEDQSDGRRGRNE